MTKKIQKLEGQLGLSLKYALRDDFILPDNCLDLGTTNVEVVRVRKKDIVNKFLTNFHYLHEGEKCKGLAVITRAYLLKLGGEVAAAIVYNPPGSDSISEFLYGREAATADYKLGTLALTRLVAHPEAPFNATGYLISHSLRMLWEDNNERLKKFDCPFRTVLSFADTLIHSGTVYRGVNGWYAGISKNNGLGGFFNPKTGDIIHVRQGKKTLTKKDCPPGWKAFKASDKLRYLWFLGGKKDQLGAMGNLRDNVKLMTRVGSIAIEKEGRLLSPSSTRCYEEVYEKFGRNIGPEKRYTEYLKEYIMN